MMNKESIKGRDVTKKSEEKKRMKKKISGDETGEFSVAGPRGEKVEWGSDRHLKSSCSSFLLN